MTRFRILAKDKYDDTCTLDDLPIWQKEELLKRLTDLSGERIMQSAFYAKETFTQRERIAQSKKLKKIEGEVWYQDVESIKVEPNLPKDWYTFGIRHTSEEISENTDPNKKPISKHIIHKRILHIRWVEQSGIFIHIDDVDSFLKVYDALVDYISDINFDCDPPVRNMILGTYNLRQ